MNPQLPDAAADAPSVPATAEDVVGRRLRRPESQGLDTNPRGVKMSVGRCLAFQLRSGHPLGRFQFGVEGDSIPSFPTVTPSVIRIGMKLYLEQFGSRLCSEVLFFESCDPDDTLLSIYHTSTFSCSMQV